MTEEQYPFDSWNEDWKVFGTRYTKISINEIMNNNDKLAKLAIRKSLLKEFHNNENERIVYLNDGDEFQIQLFNPYQYIIGVSFTFNSDSVENYRMIVLKPGERVWLDRYLDENKKLKFSTYEVGNSNEVKKAIEKNGILNIYFYKEDQTNDNIYSLGISTNWEPIDWDPLKYKITYGGNYSLNTITANYNSVSSISNCCNYDTSSQNSINGVRSIETGRIEKGSHSNQKFNHYYGKFNSWYFKKETIKILPESQRQISSNELNRKYCYNCGRKLKEKFKFCPFCGAKQ